MTGGRRQRGFTLVELMISVVVSSLLVGLVFAIYVRMSVAYRTEVVKSELQQVVRACPAVLAEDVRLAAYSVTRFRTATGAFGAGIADDLPPVMIFNDPDGWGPDSIRVYHGDTAAAAGVDDITADRALVDVDDNGQFLVGDRVALVTPRTVDPGGGGPRFVEHRACVLRVTGLVGDRGVRFDDGDDGRPYNNDGNTHCEEIAGAIDDGAEARLLLFHGRAYRIDPAPERRALGVFQMSPSGELEPDDWIDMGVGFTDLQIASRYYEDGDTADLDEDGDPERDWYSSDAQDRPSPDSERPADSVLTQVSVSVAVRTRTEISGPASRATPAFIDDSSPEAIAYNDLGDSPSIDLTVGRRALPEQHRGNHIYRSSTQVIDVRNLGIGR